MASSCYETDRHSRRVASFVRSVAESLGVDPVLCEPLCAAALEHQKFRLARLRTNDFAITGSAGMILHRFAGGTSDFGPAIDSAAAILRTCDALDEAVEFSPYDAQLLRVALEEFLLDAEPCPDEVISALRELIGPCATTQPPERLPGTPLGGNRAAARPFR